MTKRALLVYLDDADRAKLEALASGNERSASAQARLIIREYLARSR